MTNNAAKGESDVSRSTALWRTAVLLLIVGIIFILVSRPIVNPDIYMSRHVAAAVLLGGLMAVYGAVMLGLIARAPTRTRKQTAFRLLTVTLSLASTWLVAESIMLVLNASNPYYSKGVSGQWNEPDEELVFVRRPNIMWEGRGHEGPVASYIVYATDENGFRNRSNIVEADVVFVGDSFVEAGNVPEDATFVRRIAEEENIEVVNLGRGWYGPQQELKVIERYALGYKPRSIVWVVFEGNDLLDAQRYEYYRTDGDASRETKEGSKLVNLLESTYTAKAIRSLLPLAKLSGAFPVNESTSITVEFDYSMRGTHVPSNALGWRLMQDSLRAGLEICDQHGIRLVIVFIPTKLRVMGPFCRFESKDHLTRYMFSFETWDSEEDLETALGEFCGSHAIPYISCREELRAAASRGARVYATVGDNHLDVLGHEVVADLILRELPSLDE